MSKLILYTVHPLKHTFTFVGLRDIFHVFKRFNIILEWRGRVRGLEIADQRPRRIQRALRKRVGAPKNDADV